MKTTKLTSALLTLTLLICTASGCSKFEYDNSTVVAQATAIDGQKITLRAGGIASGQNLTQDGNMNHPAGNWSVPQMPGGETGDIPALPEGETMPYKEPPQIPEDGFVPGMPEGGMQMPDGWFPESMEGNMTLPFTSESDSISVTLNEEIIKTLTVGSIVQIVFGDNGSIKGLTVLGGNMQGGNMQGVFGENTENNPLPAD